MSAILKRRDRKGFRIGFFYYFKSPEIAIPAAFIACTAALYIHFQAKQLRTSHETGLVSSEAALLNTMRGAMGKEALSADKLKDASAKVMEEYGQSSVRYVDGRAEPDGGGRVHYDDLAKGAGQSIKGVLRLKDARKLPEGVSFWENEFAEALKKRSAVPTAGELPEASNAKDVLAPSGNAAYAASVDARGASVPSPDATGAGQGRDSDTGAAQASSAEDSDPQPLIAKELPEGTQVLASAQAGSSNHGAGQLLGRLAAFTGESIVKSVSQQITLPLSTLNKIPIYQLTTAEVYSDVAEQHPNESEFETSTEETGLVFDGKQPQQVAIAWAANASGGGAGVVSQELFEQAGKLSEQVLNCSALGQEWPKYDQDMKDSLANLDSARITLLAAVAVCRDLRYTWYQEESTYKKCVARCRSGSCGCSQAKWRRAMRNTNTCLSNLNAPANNLINQCSDYNNKARAKMGLMQDSKKCGSMPYETPAIFDCANITNGLISQASECHLPYDPDGKTCPAI